MHVFPTWLKILPLLPSIWSIFQILGSSVRIFSTKPQCHRHCKYQILPVRSWIFFKHGSKYSPCCPLFGPCRTFRGPRLKSCPLSLNDSQLPSPRSCQCMVRFLSNIPQNTPLVALYFVHLTNLGISQIFGSSVKISTNPLCSPHISLLQTDPCSGYGSK